MPFETTKRESELIFERYLTEIALTGVEGMEAGGITAEERFNNLCQLMLGEKLAINFVDKTTRDIIVPAYTKLTYQVIRGLANRWTRGEKFDMEFVDDLAQDAEKQKNCCLNILSAVEPGHEWS